MLRWLVAIGVTVLALTAGAFVLLADKDKKPPPVPRPGAFYRIPHPLPHGPPGTIVRSQPIAGLPVSEKGWRVLYISHGFDGHRTAVSGMIIVPAGPTPRHHRHIVAFAHGTLGVAARCGPSVLGGAARPSIEGLGRFIKAGDAVVIPDYQGLGTAGPHPYLVGKAAARNVIDGVRAVRKLPGVRAGRSYAVFGESQGAQAAIAVGQLAPHYGRGLKLVGIAAAATPIRLSEVFAHTKGTPTGAVLAAYTLSSWAQVYDESKLDDVVAARAQRAVRSIDNYCVAEEQQPASAVPAAVVARMGFRHKNPTRMKVWATLLRRNSLRPFTTRVPMLIAQGGKDALITADQTETYVRSLCERADRVDYRLYPGAAHETVGSATAGFAAGWIAGRFAKRRAPSSCPS